MDVKEIRRLLEALAASDVREFTYDTGDYKLSIKRGAEGQVGIGYVPMPAVQPQSAPPHSSQATAQAAAADPQPAALPTAAASSGQKLVEVTAPIVGTFYSSPSPDAGPFVKLGDRVSAGTVLCIIEAMKLMNEIEAETNGVVREINVSNGEPVEYGQVLFRIEPV